MRRSGFTHGSRVFFMVFVLMMAVLPFMAGCGSSGGGGGDSGGGGTGGGGIIADSNIVTDSGITNGGASKESTQTMTGSLPNPTGSTTTYGGKAYLVLNGDKIPLDVVSSTTSTIIPDPTIDPDAELQIRTKPRNGKENYANYVNKIRSVLPALKARAAGDMDWVYSVTFSLNAGGNTISIEVYDLNDTLFARTETWNVVGVIEPTSLVVTLWWNTNGTDIDLHMSPDDGATHCFYSNKSAGQMQLDYDNTRGYGPEHITIDKASGTNKYKIKVYYYADHNTNDPPSTTPTTASVTAAVNGEVKLSASSTLSDASTSSGWTSGSHVWDVGEVEVNAPSRYTVVMADPDLGSFPTVKLTVTVTDPAKTGDDSKVTGLAASNFYVINASKVMSPVTVTAAENVYTLTFTDILAGKRDIFVYAIKPAAGDVKMQAGLSNTKTYGTNYALLVSLNEYPPQQISGQWFDDAAQPTKFFVRAWTKKKDRPTNVPQFAVEDADFVTTLTDTNGIRSAVTVTATGITKEGWDAAKSKYAYKLSYDRPANYLDYDSQSTTFKKEIWLSWCLKDTTDLNAALLAKGTGMSNTSWDAANITIIQNAAATEAAILTKIQDIAGAMKKYDLFLFHFSGHGSGMPAAGNDAQYLCAYEDANWISVNDLKAKLDLIPNAGGGITNSIVLLDACHTGNFIGKAPDDASITRNELIEMKYRPFVPQKDETQGNLRAFSQLRADLTGMSNTYVMAAQKGTDPSWDDGNLKNGVFTYYLLEGIRVNGKTVSAAPANIDHSPVVSAEEAFLYLEPKVVSWVTASHGYSAGDFQSPQAEDNSTSTGTFLIYNW